ncbi:MAG: tRNA (adenosine(37)-N6)-threonylcarbamoyltransferase complex dimerization subunit type 1 TsaB [Haemophilus parainfluenzae]|uniref:tRNA (adenosine(37)-N6)-threonylcarbamoyltransferase complex dimerization subunit type 1 TsaB n=1 Tax=Haemophilus sp. HMSC061E01 TaxID=1715211 RepID=UPI0008A1C4C1|nr:tRNA (adenosine(37)-N6)-threonylcarbamoyltransferase complex dimerization subunit type 1 TsaB [Haemophilus sp. HMSC061E01]MBS5558804.1 tRNA (adenosine(37)-N6)-threonylcarbamoyltransferase complex dimerization subunit type 1 TsaB [Haemophilus parainfluenzae]MBS6684177.1 tRNA (adenosine(37)-N6)-threonylcarbamoyltransferase complex dimerization subunit type 1 TsaB [Haemophilus parainfluenzae]OFL94402.1 tRNA threonylcarbamoyladenosine biosynthesis protein TsaB [Haemophilus sp. HMSC061E01]
MKNITLLALDTSTEACSVALWHKGEKTHLDELAQRTHTKRILPMIDELLANSGINLKQVDALAFGRGPGSFTGVRVGAGIAQGLALGADLPVIAVSNLTAMVQAAFELHQAENVAAAIDARMNEVYFSQVKREKVRSELGEFFQWNPVIEEQVCQPEKVLEQLSDLSAYRVGTGWAAYPQFKDSGLEGSDIILPSAQYMLELALTDYAQNKIISALEIEPVYLRNEVTWKKLPGRE